MCEISPVTRYPQTTAGVTFIKFDSPFRGCGVRRPIPRLQIFKFCGSMYLLCLIYCNHARFSSMILVGGIHGERIGMQNIP